MDQGADKILAPSVQRLPHGAKHGGGVSQNVPKVPVGVAPHAFDARCSPKSRNVVPTTQNPGTIVHDIPNPQVKILRLQVLLKSSVSY